MPDPVASSPPESPVANRAVSGMLFGALLSLAGIFATGTRGSDGAGWLLVAGWALLGWSLHRYGRAAPGETIA